MITDPIGRHQVLLPINHKNYNFREKKNSQVMEDREKYLQRRCEHSKASAPTTGN